MIKLLICFTSCLLDLNLLVTLYFSFYYLLYFEGLMCFVQVFQVTGIYVPSESQLLIILKGRNFKHFQFILFKFLFNIMCFVPMYFCKLLGLCFYAYLQALWFVPCFMQPFMFCLNRYFYINVLHFLLSTVTLVPLQNCSQMHILSVLCIEIGRAHV